MPSIVGIIYIFKFSLKINNVILDINNWIAIQGFTL